jgi:hypothetical protein
VGGLHAKDRTLTRLKKEHTRQKLIHNENSKAVLYILSLTLFAMFETLVLVVRFLSCCSIVRIATVTPTVRMSEEERGI